MPTTIGDILYKYKSELVNCSRGYDDSCNRIIENVSERIIETSVQVPPGVWFWFIVTLVIFVILFLFLGIRIVRPTHRYLVETLGKYKKTFEPGFHWIIPLIQRTVPVNITEQMVDIEGQVVITKDNLNVHVDGVVYYKVEDPFKAMYNVDDHKLQLATLARTTLRAVIGKMTLTDANEKRAEINTQIEEVLDKETDSYGVDVLRVELQSIDPPKDVQEAMNEVVKAERMKQAEIDKARRVETEADGVRMAAIKRAEGTKQAAILEAEGKAQAFELVNKAFIDNAQILKQLEVTQASLERNSKVIIVEKGTSLQAIIGEIPLKGLMNERGRLKQKGS